MRQLTARYQSVSSVYARGGEETKPTCGAPRQQSRGAAAEDGSISRRGKQHPGSSTAPRASARLESGNRKERKETDLAAAGIFAVG